MLRKSFKFFLNFDKNNFYDYNLLKNYLKKFDNNKFLKNDLKNSVKRKYEISKLIFSHIK